MMSTNSSLIVVGRGTGSLIASLHKLEEFWNFVFPRRYCSPGSPVRRFVRVFLSIILLLCKDSSSNVEIKFTIT